jgi:hypothetical protein
MKPNFKRALTATGAACLSVLSLTACQSGEPDIVGKWTCPDAKGASLEVEFKPTGDYAVTYSNGLPPEHGKYERKLERILYTPQEDAPPPQVADASAADNADDTDDSDAPPPIPKPSLPDKIVTTYAFGANGLMLGHYGGADVSNSQRFCTPK